MDSLVDYEKNLDFILCEGKIFGRLSRGMT